MGYQTPQSRAAHWIEKQGKKKGLVVDDRSYANRVDLPRAPVKITGAIETLERRGFNPMEVAIDLYDEQYANRNLKECRMLLERIMDYAYPKHKSVSNHNSFDVLQIRYDTSAMNSDNAQIIEYREDDRTDRERRDLPEAPEFPQDE